MPDLTGSSSGVTLSWERPTSRSNGSRLDNLVGYRIYGGTDPEALAPLAELCSPDATRWAITDLPSGTWYFRVTAIDDQNLESDPTAPVSKTID